MKTLSFLGSIALASALVVAPAMAAGKGSPGAAVNGKPTTATFQPQQDPLGPKLTPMASSPAATAGSANGQVYRIIPPPQAPRGVPRSSTAIDPKPRLPDPATEQ